MDFGSEGQLGLGRVHPSSNRYRIPTVLRKVQNPKKKFKYITLGCNRNRMPLSSKASNIVQNIFYLYDVDGFTLIIAFDSGCNQV